MRARILPLLLAAVAGVLAWGAGADSAERGAVQATAAAKRAPGGAKGLWASINKCDTKAAPDTVGVRGSMPGLGKKRKTIASMRFKVQFKRPSDGTWIDAGADAKSGWKRLGAVTSAVVESGQDFTFEPPATGKHVLRGVVDFRWTKGGRVVRDRTRITEAGHPSSAGGDPAAFSAAICSIS